MANLRQIFITIRVKAMTSSLIANRANTCYAAAEGGEACGLWSKETQSVMEGGVRCGKLG